MASSATNAFVSKNGSLMESIMSDDEITGIHHVDAMDPPEQFSHPTRPVANPILSDFEHYKKRIGSFKSFMPVDWQASYELLDLPKQKSWTQVDYSILLGWLNSQSYSAGLSKPIAQNKESMEVLLTDIKRMTSGFTEMRLKMEKLEQEVRTTKTIQVEKPVVSLQGVQIEPFNVEWVINLFSVLYVKNGATLGHPLLSYKEKMKKKPTVVQQWLRSLKAGTDADTVESLRRLAAELNQE